MRVVATMMCSVVVLQINFASRIPPHEGPGVIQVITVAIDYWWSQEVIVEIRY